MTLENYFRCPSSPLVDNLIKLLQNGNDLERFVSRSKSISKGKQEISVVFDDLDGKKAAKVSIISEKTECHYLFTDTSLLTKSNKTTIQILLWMLIKIREHGITEFPTSVSFKSSEMVEADLYPSTANIAYDIKKVTKVLKSIQVKYVYPVGKSTREFQGGLFDEISMKSGRCTISLNQDVDWNAIARNFFLLPKNVFIQSGAYLDTAYTICNVSRQRTRSIDEQGGFTISLNLIAIRANLPIECKARYIGQKVWKPLCDIIEETNELLKPYGFGLHPIEDSYTTIKDKLTDGNVMVTVSGFVSDEYAQIHQIESNKIKQFEKMKQKANAKKSV